MAEILLFHHIQGLTSGFGEFADAIREAGHTVHTPDLFEGRTFESIDEGAAYCQEIGFGTVAARGVAAAGGLPDGLVYGGISLGVMPAQRLAQTRPGARGALLIEACVPVAEFSDGWPPQVPVQIHGMDQDPFFAREGDIDAARDLIAGIDDDTPAELFVYPGDQHLFADRSLPSYAPEAAALLMERVLAFLGRLR
jgi:dienelactone hydrolase